VTARVALAVNPVSGRGRGVRAGRAVAAQLAADGVDVVPVPAVDAAGALAGLRAARADGVDALVVVGGDGMVHLGVNAVAGTGCPLGIVAAGTGNDIARELGLRTGDPAGAARDLVRALEAGSVRAVDAARCLDVGAPPPVARGPHRPHGPHRPDAGPGVDGPHGDRWFAGVLAAGFDALVNERADGWRWPRGDVRYDLAILRELPVLRPRDYVLTLDGVERHLPAVMVVVANGPAYGGGMRICPDARMDDGLLDVLVVAPLSRTALIRIYPRVYRGTHVSDPRVSVERVRQVRVAAEGIVATADGERLARLPITAQAVPGALRVLVPPPAS